VGIVLLKCNVTTSQRVSRRCALCSPTQALWVRTPCQEGSGHKRRQGNAQASLHRWDVTTCKAAPSYSGSHHAGEVKPALKRFTESTFSTIRNRPPGPECMNSRVPLVGENNAHPSITTNQEQGCLKSSTTPLCLQVTSTATALLLRFPISSALQRAQGLAAPLLCKYTERLSSLQRFEANKCLYSVQNRSLPLNLQTCLHRVLKQTNRGHLLEQKY